MNYLTGSRYPISPNFSQAGTYNSYSHFKSIRSEKLNPFLQRASLLPALSTSAFSSHKMQYHKIKIVEPHIPKRFIFFQSFAHLWNKQTNSSEQAFKTFSPKIPLGQKALEIALAAREKIEKDEAEKSLQRYREIKEEKKQQVEAFNQEIARAIAAIEKQIESLVLKAAEKGHTQQNLYITLNQDIALSVKNHFQYKYDFPIFWTYRHGRGYQTEYVVYADWSQTELNLHQYQKKQHEMYLNQKKS